MSQTYATSHNRRDVELTFCEGGDRLSPEIAARFWSKVATRSDGECWLWTASTMGGNGRRKGYAYGQFTITRGGRQQHAYAHRVAYELAHGPFAPELSVCHRCDKPLCCNPAHLFLGSHAENVRDAARKGRLHMPRPRGQKVTDAQVDEIVRLAASGMKQVRLAERYGVSKVLISRIIKGTARQWRHRKLSKEVAA